MEDGRRLLCPFYSTNRINKFDTEYIRRDLVTIKKDLKKKSFDAFFDSRWERYPQKDSKREARKQFNKTVTSKDLLRKFDIALNRYLKHLSDNPWRNPKSGSTFFHNWMDWVDYKEKKKPELEKTPEFNQPPVKRAKIEHKMATNKEIEEALSKVGRKADKWVK